MTVHSHIPTILHNIDIIDSHLVPSCYRKLLSQQRYMTLILQEHFNSNLQLNLINQVVNHNILSRTITLLKNDTIPVLFAEININLNALSLHLKDHVLESKLPLGFLLKEHGIAENFSNMDYFKISPNRSLLNYLQCQKDHYLFGRINCLHNQDGLLLAKSLEILTSKVNTLPFESSDLSNLEQI